MINAHTQPPSCKFVTTPTRDPAERDVEEMTVIPTSYNCPLPTLCFTPAPTHGSLVDNCFFSPLCCFYRFPRFNSLTWCKDGPAPSTDRPWGKREGERENLPFCLPRRLFKCMGRTGEERFTLFYARGIFSSYRDFCTLLSHVITAFKFQ